MENSTGGGILYHYIGMIFFLNPKFKIHFRFNVSIVPVESLVELEEVLDEDRAAAAANADDRFFFGGPPPPCFFTIPDWKCQKICYKACVSHT